EEASGGGDDFELDFGDESEEASGGGDDFELDFGDESEEASGGGDDFELDFGDESEEASGGDDFELDMGDDSSGADAGEGEFELDLDFEGEPEGASDEDDFGFELDDDGSGAGEGEGEFSLDLGEKPVESEKTSKGDDFEFDLDFEDDANDETMVVDLDSEPKAEPAEQAKGDDFDFNFDMDDGEGEKPAEEGDLTQVYEMGVPEDGEPSGQTKKTAEPPGVPGKKEKSAKADKKKKSKKPAKTKKRSPVFALLAVLLLLGGGGFGVYTYRDAVVPHVAKIPGGNNILKIFGISTKKGINPIEEGVNYKFVENSQYGDLFVITGEVINEFSVPHKSIKVTGRILAQGKVAEEETVFCGNLLPDTELSELNLDDIKKRLNSPSGRNTKVNPGNKLPFMIVFPSRPDMEEYTIKVEGSSPVQG
ncbi:MAG: DUF3426 domain-containing protein, partial [Desulfobacteraceae bacterium]|nr:DUF3426 domain-containing protein [Desulfobacteraceae bacterium]